MTRLKKLASTMICLTATVGATHQNAAHAATITNFATLTPKQIMQSYYFDWNRNAQYRAALFKAFSYSKTPMPQWLNKASGPSKPSKIIVNGSTKFVFLNTCKQHDCSENNVYVLFDPVSRTTAAIAKFDDKLTWIGGPNAAMKKILSANSGLE